jgi:heme-degrading monooxygenase HmoA
MSVTRINEFSAAPDQAVALSDFLASVIGRILDAPGCQSCQLLRHHDDGTRFAIIEVWDSVESHQAAASRIPPELLVQARTLFAEPARGAYYDVVRNGSG